MLDEARERLLRRFTARGVILTGSGTEALTAALRIAFREQGNRRIALPAWGCYALVSAAVGAGADEVFYYDLDPRTLAADPAAVASILAAGVGTVVLAHLYGFPAASVETVAHVRDTGAFLVEDAAQGIGGSLDGVGLGTLGRISVLSFGRGKGAACGGGGALLLHDPASRERADRELGHLGNGAGARRLGWGELGRTAGQWAFGRPALYRIPASIPFLGLGETRYRPPTEPEPMAEMPVRLLREVLRTGLEAEPERRRGNARRLESLVEGSWKLSVIRPVERGVSGSLRFPCLLPEGSSACPSLGILPGYPRLLPDLGVLPPAPPFGSASIPGALELRDRLHTAPVHGGVGEDELTAAARWLTRVVRDEDRP